MRPPGVIIAGGLARRMGGGDKTLLRLNGKPILDHVIARLGPQVSRLALNANGNPQRFAAWNLPIIADPHPDHPGPLAGILAGLTWMKSNLPDARAVITVPADSPFLPDDLVTRLMSGSADADVVMAARGPYVQPVVALWSLALLEPLAAALQSTGGRSVEAFARQCRHALAPFDDTPFDPFFNVNTPEDLAAAERALEAHALEARGR